MQHPIRVRAKTGVLVPVPRLRGGQAEYVGRDVDHEAFKRGETDHEKLYPVKKDPTEYSQKVDGADVFAEIQRALRDGDLLLELKAPVATKTLAGDHGSAGEGASDRGPKGKS